MTIREAIEAVDRLTPNQYENIDKVRWLSELDGVIYLEIEKTHGSGNPVCEPWVRTRDPLDREWCGCVPQEKPSEQTFEGYPETVDLDTKLRIPWPYDEIYRWYLEMMEKWCGTTTQWPSTTPTTRRIRIFTTGRTCRK